MTERVLSFRVKVEDDGSVRVLNQVEDATDRLGGAAQRASGEQTNLNRDTRGFGPASRAAHDGAQRLRTALQLVGAAAVALTLRNAARDARDFGRGMAEVSTLLENMDEIPRLADGVKRLSVEFGQVPTDQIRALYNVISAGADSSAKALDILTASNRLAVGGVTSVNVAADGLTSALNAYEAAGFTATEVSDKFFATMRAGKTTVEEIAASIGKSATIAQQTGTELDELLAAYATLTTTGTKTTTAMEGIRAVLVAVLKPSEEAKELAARLGLQFDVAAIQANGFAGFLKEVADKTGGAAEAISVLFGGAEAITPVLSLAGARADAFASILDRVRNSAGETERAVAKMADTSGRLSDRFDAAMTLIRAAIGEGMLDGLDPTFRGVIENFDELEESARLAGEAIGAALGVVSEAVAFLAENIEIVEAAVGALIAGKLVAWIGSVAAAFTAATTAAGGLTALLAANPITAAALAVGGLAAATIYLGQQVRQLESDEDAYGDVLARVNGLRDEAKTASEERKDELVKETEAILQQVLAERELQKAFIERLRTQSAAATAGAAADNIAGLSIQSLNTGELEAAAEELAEIDATISEVQRRLAEIRSGEFGEAASGGDSGTGGAGGGGGGSGTLGKLNEQARDLVASLDTVGTAVDDYREGVALLDRALATGLIESQAEHALLLGKLDGRLKDVLGNEPASAVRAWAEATGDLNDQTLVLNSLEEALAEHQGRRIERLAAVREAMADELRLAGLTEEQRDIEIATRELLNAAREAGLDLTDDQARADARRHVDAIRQQEAELAARTRNVELLRRFTGEIEDGFKGAFKEAFREGEGGFERLMSSFENMFLDMLAELAFQALARPVIVPIVQALGGALGVSQGGVAQVLGEQGFQVNGTTGPTGIGLGGAGDLLGNLFGGNFLSGSAGVGNAFVDVAQFFGAGAETQAIFGNAGLRLSSPVGAIGGFAGNMLGNAIFGGDRGIGADIGGSIGAIAGSFIPIPGVGTAIGGLLGNFLGGLFGGDKGDPIGHTNIGVQNGRLVVGASGVDNGADASVTQRQAQEAVQAINRIADQLGLTVVNQVGALGVSQGNASGPQSAQAFVDAFFANAGANLTSDSAAINAALGSGLGTEALVQKVAAIREVEAAIAQLDFEDPYEGLTDIERAVGQLRDGMDDLRDRALALGVAVDRIDAFEASRFAAMQDVFEADLNSALLGMTDPVRAAWEGLMDTHETRLRDAIALETDLAAVEHFNLLERAQFLAQLSERDRERLTGLVDLTDDLGLRLATRRTNALGIAQDERRAAEETARGLRQLAVDLRRFAESARDARFALTVGPVSPLTPGEQRAALFNRLTELSDEAFGEGNTSALAALPQVASQFLDASRAFFADARAFQADFDFVQALLGEAADLAEGEADTSDAEAARLDAQTGVLEDILKTLSSPSPDADLLAEQLAALLALGAADTPVVAAIEDLIAITASGKGIEEEAARLASERVSAIEAASSQAIAEAQADAARRTAEADARAEAALAEAQRLAAQLAAARQDVRAGLEERVRGLFMGRVEDNLGDQVTSPNDILSVVRATEAGRALEEIDPDAFRQIVQERFPGLPFAAGGLVTGPGTGTSDSIPARLSNGEFVVRAAAVDRVGPTVLAAINEGRVPMVSGPGAGQDAGMLALLDDRLRRLEDAMLAAGDATVAAIETGNAQRAEGLRAAERTEILMRRAAGAGGRRAS